MRDMVNASYQQGIVLGADPIEHLDEEWALPCEFEDHRGPEAARWVLWPSCCTINGAAYILGCDACKDRKLDPEASIICDDCERVYTPAPRAWRRVEPLSKGA